MRASALFYAMLCSGAVGCSGELDAGYDRPHGPLPVDERNPIVITNDGAHDNWQGEYAALFANAGGPPLAGIIVSASVSWPSVDVNLAGWRDMVAAARASGLRGIPDPIASVGPPLGRPANGSIDATVPNRSEGARAIVEISRQVSRPYRPMVVVTGGRLTEAADAYLIDPSVVERVVVLSSLGTASSSGGAMGIPNGEMDPWADVIVLAKFRYIQVSAYYDQSTDVPSSLLPQLPANPFGDWIRAKSSRILTELVAADQVGVIALGLSSFVTITERVSRDTSNLADAPAWPLLRLDPAGPARLVTRASGALATSRFWQLLLNPATYGK